MNKTTFEKISIAPMVDYTDKHFRYLMNLLSQKVTLFSEMCSVDAILKGNCAHILEQPVNEKNCILQIATDCPQKAYLAIQKAENCSHYCGYNLNVGCPSEKIQKACYGACLMREPTLVNEILLSMRKATQKPISAKIRLGIKKRPESLNPPDNLTEYKDLHFFVRTIHETVESLIVHARIAILEGFSPKDNRAIPPLKPEWVLSLKKDFPNLNIIFNGGVKSLKDIKNILDSSLNGVMIGRAAYDNPYLIAKATRLFLNENTPVPTRRQVLEEIEDYTKYISSKGENIHHLYPHLMGLFHEKKGAKNYRQMLSNRLPLRRIIESLPSEILDEIITPIKN